MAPNDVLFNQRSLAVNATEPSGRLTPAAARQCAAASAAFPKNVPMTSTSSRTRSRPQRCISAGNRGPHRVCAARWVPPKAVTGGALVAKHIVKPKAASSVSKATEQQHTCLTWRTSGSQVATSPAEASPMVRPMARPPGHTRSGPTGLPSTCAGLTQDIRGMPGQYGEFAVAQVHNHPLRQNSTSRCSNETASSMAQCARTNIRIAPRTVRPRRRQRGCAPAPPCCRPAGDCRSPNCGAGEAVSRRS